jgi:O-antigen ligase
VVYTTANALALFLGPPIAIAATLLLHVRDRFVQIGSAVFLAVAGPAMLLTFSRGGLLAMAVVAVGLALSHRRRWWLLAGTAAVAVLLFVVPPIHTRVVVEFQNVGGTTFWGRAGRIALWTATLQMLGHFPVFGAGLSGFAERIGPYWDSDHPERFIDPHNIVLNFWVETGVLGVVAVTWLLVVAFMWAWRGWRNTEGMWRAISLGALFALVAIVVHGLVDVPYFKNDLSLEFWTVVAMIECARRASPGREPRRLR